MIRVLPLLLMLPWIAAAEPEDEPDPNSPGADQPAKADDGTSFASWARKFARSHQQYVQGFYAGDLTGNARKTTRAALLFPLAPDARENAPVPTAVWLIELDPDHRWRIVYQEPQATGGGTEDTIEAHDDFPPAEWQELDGSIDIDDTDECSGTTTHIAFRGGEPVVVGQTRERMGCEAALSLSTSEDWDTLTFKEGTDTEARGAIILATGAKGRSARVPETFNTVISGDDSWKGRSDASIQISATDSGGDVRIHVKVADDARIPVPRRASSEQFMAADHLELWWADPSAKCPEKATSCEAQIRRLGIGATSSGKPDVRWLYPPDLADPVPAVTGKSPSFDVKLPWNHLAGPKDGKNGRLTVAYSDTDPDADHKVVATSRLHPGDVGSLGEITTLPGGRRYPVPEYKLSRIEWVPWKK